MTDDSRVPTKTGKIATSEKKKKRSFMRNHSNEGRRRAVTMMAGAVFILFSLLPTALGIRVLESTVKLGDNREGVAISGAQLDPQGRRVKIKDMTICTRFKMKILGGYEGKSQLWTISDFKKSNADAEFEMLFLGLDYPKSFFGFGYPRQEGSYKSWIIQFRDDHGKKELWGANRWIHLCLAYQKSTGFVKIIRDGEAASSINHPDPEMTLVDIPEDFLEKIYLGRCAYDFNYACSSPESQYTDLNIWDKFLSTEKLMQWTTCQNLEKGNIVNWDTANFKLVNMTEIDVSMDSICKPTRPGDIIIPNKRTFESLFTLCRKFRGKTSVVKTERMQKELSQLILNTESCAVVGGNDAFWNGWWDQPSEGTFIDANGEITLTEDSYKPWYLGEPNGNDEENCGVSWVRRDAWNDEGCFRDICGFCELEQAPVFTLRGLCRGSRLDTKYSWTRDSAHGFYSLNGYKDAVLSKDIEENNWKIALYTTNETFAIANTTDYPFGFQQWTINNDPCFGQGEVTTILGLNACLASDFNCADGQCIPMESRCDGILNCHDKSDEVGCDVYSKDASYIKTMPPEPIEGQNVTTVFLSMDILAILEISEVDSFISMQISIDLTWSDPRLTMSDLNERDSLNSLTLESRQEIWIPQVIFYNTEIKMESLNDEKAFALVHRNGSYRRQNDSFLHNSYLYEGSENPITLTRVYSAKFICEYNMAIYPFDSQKCSSIFMLKGNAGNFIKLVADQSAYLGPVDLPQYFVMETTITEITVPPNTQAVEIEITFGRRILSTMLSSYLPTFFICLLSFSTNYFKSFFFEAIVTVNLTSMLALTTLFISVSNSLPKTAYIKMIDIWLIFCLFIPFAEVMLQTFLEYLRDTQAVNHHGSVQFTGLSGPPALPPNSPQKQDKRQMEINSRVINVKTTKLAAAGNKVGPETGGRKPASAAGDDPYEAENTHIKTEGIRNPRAYKLAKLVADRGLPGFYLAFLLAYFAVGVTFYMSVMDSILGQKQERQEN